MLKQRAATAAILLSLFLVVVFWFPTPWFAVALSVVLLIGAFEWAALVQLTRRVHQVAWLALFCVLLWTAWAFHTQLTPGFVAVGAVWWLVALLWLWRAPDSAGPPWARLVTAVIVMLPAWTALVYLHATDLRLLVALFLIVWLADTGAYFTGRALGRHKLAPSISPGKTVEGLLGGIVAVAVFAVAGAAWTGLDPACGLVWLVVCIVTALTSVVGDLWESRLKRNAGVKDSGTLLPGHGGVLDRIDSVTAAAPVFVTGLYLTGASTPSCAGALIHT